MTDPGTQPLLSGALAGFALADVLQLLELGARSGVLAVDGGPSGSGRIVVRCGRVVSATAAAAAMAGVPSAVASLLELASGRWTFHGADDVAPLQPGGVRDDAGVSIGAILVEAAWRRDERSRAGAGAGIGSVVPRAVLSGQDAGEGGGAECLTALHLRVLAAVDGVHDVAAIAASLRSDVARVRDALAALRGLGLVEDAPCAGYLT